MCVSHSIYSFWLLFQLNFGKISKNSQKWHKFYIGRNGKRYLMKQEEASKKLPGEWILLFNDEIVDHSINIEDILRTCEEKFPADKFPDDEIKISKVMDGSIRSI